MPSYVRERQRVTKEHRWRVFSLKETDPQRKFWFWVNKDGSFHEDAPEATLALIRQLESGTYEGLVVIDEGVQVEPYEVVEPAVIICDCGKEVTLQTYWNKCSCGRKWNFEGGLIPDVQR